MRKSLKEKFTEVYGNGREFYYDNNEALRIIGKYVVLFIVVDQAIYVVDTLKTIEKNTRP